MNRLKKENKVSDTILDKVSGGAVTEDVKPVEEDDDTSGGVIAAFNSDGDGGGNIKGTPGGNKVAQ